MGNYRSNSLDGAVKKMQEVIAKNMASFDSVNKLDVAYGVPAKKLDDGVNIEEYAEIVHDGSFTNNIPSRPFLRTVKDNYSEEIRSDITKFLRELKDDVVSTEELKPEEVGKLMEKYVAIPLQNYTKDNVLNSDWVANAEITIKRKGSSTPLVDTGEMLNSIVGIVVDDK